MSKRIENRESGKQELLDLFEQAACEANALVCRIFDEAETKGYAELMSLIPEWQEA